MSTKLAAPPLTEAQFQRRVMDAAILHGWMAVHYRPARTRSGGWATAVQGHKGGPDLMLARDGVVIHAELKTDTGRLTKEQKEWSAMLGDHWRLWRPRDWDAIERELR